MPATEERDNQLAVKIVFLDSNCLVRTSEQDPGLQNLLRMAQNNEIRLMTSRTVVAEWISNIRDYYVASCTRVRSAIDDERGELRANPLFIATGESDFLQTTPARDTLFVDADRRATDYVTTFMTRNRVTIVEIGSDHASRVINKYTAWEPPFNRPENDVNLDDKATRKARKTHLPDGLIIEAIIDAAVGIDEFYVVCEDDRLGKTLPPPISVKTGSLKKIVEMLSSPPPPPPAATPEPPEPPQPQGQDELITPEAERPEGTAQPEVNTEPTIFDRILGYLLWLAGGGSAAVPKEIIIGHLKKREYTDEQIDEAMQSLVASGAVKDTGHRYALLDRDLGRAAASRIRSEILSLLG